VNLTLHIDAGRDALPEDLDVLTRRLREELGDLDLDSVSLVKEGAAPSGTKSADAVTLGALAITLLPSVLPKLIECIQAWSLRGQNRTVKIKANVGDRSIELEYSAGMSEAALKGLIDTLTSKLAVQ
jgi:hypothetical protein